MNIIELKKINKYFGSGGNRVHVLKNIDLQIEKGDFVAIIGQSGSGKSTMMNIIGCLDVPTAGSYKINGVEVGRMDKDQLAELRCKTFGFIFQRYNLLNSLKASENAALPAVYLGLNAEARDRRAVELLKKLDLGNKLANRPNELSGGQQQRVSIARALMNGGEIILADEPTGALDSKSGEMVMDIIKGLHKQGHTIILVTHDSHIAAQASRIIEIKDGEIVSDERRAEDFYEVTDTVEDVHRSRLDALKYSFLESLKMSLHAILANKMRSLLTMLGIIIGIASVVSVVALGNASQAKIMEQINSMGTNTIDIMPGKGFGDMRSGRVKTLKVRDSDYLGKQGFIDNSTPNVSASGTLVYRNYSLTAQLRGVGSTYFDVKGRKIAQGRIFTDEEVDRMASVVVIDDNTLNEMFENDPNPLGKVIIFNKKPLTDRGDGKGQQPRAVVGNDEHLGPLYHRHVPGQRQQRHQFDYGESFRPCQFAGGRRGNRTYSDFAARQEGLFHDQHRQYQTDGAERDRHNEIPDCQHCRHIADCGRHRGNEHHAGFGDRTDAGNRHPHGDRRQAGGHSPAVSDRGDSDLPGGRIYGRDAVDADRFSVQHLFRKLRHDLFHRVDRAGAGLFDRDRHHFRLYAGQKRLQPQPY